MVNKKTVGIITFHRAINYGAVWQTWALQNVLQKKGFNVEIIDYYPLYFRRINTRLPKKIQNFIIKLFIIRQFKSFIKKHLNLSAEQYTDQSDFNNNSLKYDFCICGSDQVWSSKILKKDYEPYFLGFTTDSKKIAYAASMGSDSIPPSWTQYIKKTLTEFKSISVREEFAKEELKKIGFEQVEVVLDPTLLLNKDEYLTILQKPIAKEYILVIDLDKSKLLKESAIELKKKTGLPIVNISGSYRHYAKNPLGISPLTWLNYIRSAKYICTNSFHGLALSIVFEKQFYYISKPDPAKNNRALSLLEPMELMDRLISEKKDFGIICNINYTPVQEKLSALKSQSAKFLDKSLL